MSPEDKRQVERASAQAKALTEESHGGTIGDALKYLLGVQSSEALLVLMAQAELVIDDRKLRTPADAEPGDAPAFLTGVEMGIAAERARREQQTVPGGVRP